MSGTREYLRTMRRAIEYPSPSIDRTHRAALDTGPFKTDTVKRVNKGHF